MPRRRPMATRKQTRLVATLCAAAYLWLATGVSGQLVYCAGADGHGGIEQSHPDGSCADSPRNAHAAIAGVQAGDAEPCTDTPLLSGFATAAPKHGTFTDQDPTPISLAMLPATNAEQAPTSARLGPPPLMATTQVARSLGSTVLRV